MQHFLEEAGSVRFNRHRIFPPIGAGQEYNAANERWPIRELVYFCGRPTERSHARLRHTCLVALCIFVGRRAQHTNTHISRCALVKSLVLFQGLIPANLRLLNRLSQIYIYELWEMSNNALGALSCCRPYLDYFGSVVEKHYI